MRVVDARVCGSSDAPVTVRGWVRSVRRQKKWSFLSLSDGSCAETLQVVFPGRVDASVTTGSAVAVTGSLQQHMRLPEKELHCAEDSASAIELLGGADAETYPLQKKEHSFEFLRDVVHLRGRTATMGSALRVRHTLSGAVSASLDSQGCTQVHTPIITGSDCEGAGETFRVLPAAELRASSGGGGGGGGIAAEAADGSAAGGATGAGFFGTEAHLTVSGQLQAEAFAAALGRVYTFGPTFRAENSNTARHLAEFWMIEPELSFAGAAEAMDSAEAVVRAAVAAAEERNAGDLAVLDQAFGEAAARRSAAADPAPYARVSYSRVVEMLQEAHARGEAPAGKDGEAVDAVQWGDDLSSEQEKWICAQHADRPVFVTRFPRSLKPFYMLQADPLEDESGPVVEAFDLLVPGVGELAGGSAREHRLSNLIAAMETHGLIDAEGKAGPLEWYVDLRRYGSTPHAGYGIGFERLVQFVTGIKNIREAIPVPRAPGLCLM
ncbi:hypothetical protein FNF28_07138 [Cafeteria roenbergensis]|uniref:asparagine--tRNA ligase n=1 Tax=Cafeteria roenbergensis TaxID=33653 RepID=A0A5A8CDW9_CAFRO|nr:hypothetical protein FNF28_07138 [Cafeteria roenbergensis]